MQMDPMDHLSPAEALARLKQLIKTSPNGINITFERTEKNKLLLETYLIDDKRKLEILLSLKDSDFIKDEYSDNPCYPNDYFYVFIKKAVPLIPTYSDSPAYKMVDLYIKFYFLNEKHSLIVILSFHEAGDY